MQEIYVLNTQTKKLHILGYCYHASDKLYPKFQSKDDAYKKYGEIIECKLCENKRDKLIKKEADK